METVHDRLKRARMNAGFKTPTAFAKKYDMVPETYRYHENGGRGIRPDAAKRYADLLGVSYVWLLTGHIDAPMERFEEQGEEYIRPSVIQKSSKGFELSKQSAIKATIIATSVLKKRHIDSEEEISALADAMCDIAQTLGVDVITENLAYYSMDIGAQALEDLKK